MNKIGLSKKRILRSALFVGLIVVSAFFVESLLRTNEIGIEDYLAQRADDGQFCLKDVEVGKEWNRMLILGPYDKIDNYEVEVRFVDRKEINHTARFDSYCTIVFLQDKELVAYTHVPRHLLDFSEKGGFYNKDYVFSLCHR